MPDMLRPFAVFLIAITIAASAWAGGNDLIKKGRAAQKAGRNNAALEAYTQATQATDLTKAGRAYAFYRRGSVWGFLGENIKGINDFSKSIELDPKNGSAHSLRGYLYGTVGKYDLAEKDHVAALKLAKYQKWKDYAAWVLQHHADLWRRRGEFKKALDTTKRALQASDYDTVYFRRAWIYLDMGKKAAAKADFVRFEREMKQQGTSYSRYWPDERSAIARLRELK